MNRTFQMVRMTGTVRRLEDQKVWIDRIFRENPVMNTVYPGDSRYILEPFCMADADIEFFDLGKSPIYRESFAIGTAEPAKGDLRLPRRVLPAGAVRRAVPSSVLKKARPAGSGRAAASTAGCALNFVRYRPLREGVN